MQFTHVTNCCVPVPPGEILAQWTAAESLPRHLTHIRAIAAGESGDVARAVIILEGRHIEFVVQRTMCGSDSVCWQSLGDNFLYVLTVDARRNASDETAVQFTVAYDPPGFLPDVLETCGRGRHFKQAFEQDIACFKEAMLGLNTRLPLVEPKSAVQ